MKGVVSEDGNLKRNKWSCAFESTLFPFPPFEAPVSLWVFVGGIKGKEGGEGATLGEKRE